jgi:enamine deaminase RidA (YjgF/YER057c/UK114 family)
MERLAMPRLLNPPTVPRPASRYSQGVALTGEAQRVLVSGQIGASPDGALASGLDAQMALAFDNFLAVVEAAGLEAQDVVKIACYCVERGRIATFRRLREARLGSHAPACTYVEVAGLASPDFLVEIEGEAAREARRGET